MTRTDCLIFSSDCYSVLPSEQGKSQHTIIIPSDGLLVLSAFSTGQEPITHGLLHGLIFNKGLGRGKAGRGGGRRAFYRSYFFRLRPRPHVSVLI